MNTSMVPTTNETFNEDTTISLVSAVVKNMANPFLSSKLYDFLPTTRVMLLYRWAFNAAIRTKHATVPFIRLKQFMTTGAFIKKPA